MKIITGSTGTTHITSDDDRQFNAAIWGNDDYVLPNGSKLAATLVDNNTITIADGDICMQGCHARVNANTTETLSIATGAVGKKRIDLIVARYELNSETGYETATLKVVKGTESTGTPTAPTINSNTSLRNGATIHDMLLYTVNIDGINVTSVTPRFKQADYIGNLVESAKGSISALGTAELLLTISSMTRNTQYTLSKAITQFRYIYVVAQMEVYPTINLPTECIEFNTTYTIVDFWGWTGGGMNGGACRFSFVDASTFRIGDFNGSTNDFVVKSVKVYGIK